MDSLPVELLQLIFEYCDPESVRCLRLLTRTLADVGYDYLLPPLFTAFQWRDDVARLRSIAAHNRLRSSIQAITFNFTEVHEENARKTAYFQSCMQDRGQQASLLAETWRSYDVLEGRRKTVRPMMARDPMEVAAALRPLTKLRHVAVTFQDAPFHGLALLRQTLTVHNCTKMNHGAAIKSLNVLMEALQQASASSSPPSPSPFPARRRRSGSCRLRNPRSEPTLFTVAAMPTLTLLRSFYGSASASASALALASAPGSVASTPRTASPASSEASSPSTSSPPSPAPEDDDTIDENDSHCQLTSFSVDRFPFDLFRQPTFRRLWFQSRDVFAGLTRLKLALDTSNLPFPAAKLKAVNGLGCVIRMAPHLTHLSLAFRNYAAPRDLFVLSLSELLGESGSFMTRVTMPSRPSRASGGGGGSDGFRFGALTDLQLEGILCSEHELRGFLMRHAATLERLRLGGRGLASGVFDSSIGGGVHLYNGTFRSLFRSLRGGLLPRLQRLHLEGYFKCETEWLAPDVDDDTVHAPHEQHEQNEQHAQHGAAEITPTPVMARRRFERYLFRATTDDDWAPATDARAGTVRSQCITSEAFEAYVLGAIDEYPGRFHKQSVSGNNDL